ncbi:hypothetical protein MSI_21510 [Treponema sp. JC4]|uniref:DUF4405 domain-containing protein n=1 Tax=Treponema sp. JC4 TaxID=1124982 RepID=UPI00025B0E54|nr:DUF4405 domain-containing protein [Treponema sp. JC4]EID84366.1 hypothetical protein MSI_21510 [Treponema sp. JC4]
MNTNKLRMPLDILMTILSIILMGGTILFPDDRIHQILGMVLLALWIFHTVLNHRWYASLFKGRYQLYRIMQLVVNLGICLCAIFLMTSGLLMAWFIPADWVGETLGFARTTHLLASHWYYIFMAFHLGLHGAMLANKCFGKLSNRTVRIIPRVICILISLYGMYAFRIRGLWKYMFLQQQFFFLDLERGYLLFVLDYVSILVLFAVISHFLAKVLRWKKIEIKP